jgi:hypothetical protein
MRDKSGARLLERQGLSNYLVANVVAHNAKTSPLNLALFRHSIRKLQQVWCADWSDRHSREHTGVSVKIATGRFSGMGLSSQTLWETTKVV